MTIRTLTAALLVLVTTATLSAADEAEERVVAIVKLKFLGIKDADRGHFLSKIEEGLQFSNVRRMSETNINVTERSSKELFTDECLADEKCWAQTTQALNAPMTLSGSLTQTNDGWEADLALFARDLKRVANHAQFACPKCSMQTFVDRVRDAVADMVRANLQLARGIVVVHTQPSGADIRLDGRSIGKAPTETKDTAGKHELAASLIGREEKRVTIEITPQGRLEVEIMLPPKTTVAIAPVPPPKETWSPRNLKIAGWSLVGASLVGIIVGVALVGIDGQELGRHANSNGLLVADRYTTAAGGGALIAVGAIIGCASAVPFYFAKKKEAKLTANVGPGGAALFVEGTW